MKLKIVIKVSIHSEKDKSKALQIVVAEEGVGSVSVGKENDELEVIGEGVDSVCLVKSLRKKFRFADIVSVEEVKPPPSPQPSPPPCCTAPPPCIYPPPFGMPFNECHFYDTERPPNWFCM